MPQEPARQRHHLRHLIAVTGFFLAVEVQQVRDVGVRFIAGLFVIPRVATGFAVDQLLLKRGLSSRDSLAIPCGDRGEP